jgi:hypothetical protein
LPANLFTKDLYICVGYDISEFNQDQAILYCLNPSTYSANSNIENNANNKNIILRWTHETADGRVETITEDSDLDYEIRWYQYQFGAPSADIHSGVYWKRVNDKEYVKENLAEIEKINTYYTFYTNNR